MSAAFKVEGSTFTDLAEPAPTNMRNSRGTHYNSHFKEFDKQLSRPSRQLLNEKPYFEVPAMKFEAPDPNEGVSQSELEIKITCTRCRKECTGLCSQCKNANYCSNFCQLLDWPTHKLLCGQYSEFAKSKRPTGNHIRAIRFSVQNGDPEFIWLPCKRYCKDQFCPRYEPARTPEHLRDSPVALPFHIFLPRNKKSEDGIEICFGQNRVTEATGLLGYLCSFLPRGFLKEPHYSAQHTPIIAYGTTMTSQSEVPVQEVRNLEMKDYHRIANYLMSHNLIYIHESTRLGPVLLAMITSSILFDGLFIYLLARFLRDGYGLSATLQLGSALASLLVSTCWLSRADGFKLLVGTIVCSWCAGSFGLFASFGFWGALLGLAAIVLFAVLVTVFGILVVRGCDVIYDIVTVFRETPELEE